MSLSLAMLRPLSRPSPSRCPACRQLSKSSRRAAEGAPHPPSRPKVRTLPTGKRPTPPSPPPRPLSPFASAEAAAEAAGAGTAQPAQGITEKDVMQIVYRHTPARSPVTYYCLVVFLAAAGANLASAWRLDSLGTFSRPLLPSEEKVKAAEGKRYNQGAAVIAGATALTCATLAYMPTRRVSTITLIPRYPRPDKAENRVAWYHHADCLIHSHADFIALPFAPFRKGRRVPFAALRLVQPFSGRPRPTLAPVTKPKDTVGARLLAMITKPDPRFASIRVAPDIIDVPFTHYTLEKPNQTERGPVECEDVLVMERALDFNAQVEVAWQRQQALQQQRLGKGM